VRAIWRIESSQRSYVFLTRRDLTFIRVVNPMRQLRENDRQVAEQTEDHVTLDLVVPFTTPLLTQSALNAANRLGAGLNAEIRLLKVQIVPYPLDLTHSPVPEEFLERQMRGFRSDMATRCEIRFARDAEAGLQSGLKKSSLVILASAKRRWKTHTERLAQSLRRAGYTVVMVSEKENECSTSFTAC
jgi:hypothetical protein